MDQDRWMLSAWVGADNCWHLRRKTVYIATLDSGESRNDRRGGRYDGRGGRNSGRGAGTIERSRATHDRAFAIPSVITATRGRTLACRPPVQPASPGPRSGRRCPSRSNAARYRSAPPKTSAAWIAPWGNTAMADGTSILSSGPKYHGVRNPAVMRH